MKTYLIIGGTGSLGKKLIERLIPNNFVCVYSRDEGKHWTIKNELSENPNARHVQFFVGDIRDRGRLRDVVRQVNPDRIIIAAALKQVDTCELSPSESVQTNLVGTQNVVDVLNEITERGISTLFVSTDKACAPVNVYGMCKALSERIVTSQAQSNCTHNYLCVRYGNVLESRGSIIPLFKYQSEHGEFLTVTDPDMTRYLMTLDDSVDLILAAFENGVSGETWIPKLNAMRIGDLAELYSEISGRPIKIIGLRPGEKKHEDLVNESESVRHTSRNLSSSSAHYVLEAAYKRGESSRFTYSSSDRVMDKKQLKDYLVKLGIFNMTLDQFPGTTIEEIITNRKD